MMKKALIFLLIITMFLLPACSKNGAKRTIVIYSAASTERLQDMQDKLSAKFPQYSFVCEYLSTSKLAAKLLAEGNDTEIDIIHDLAYTNLFKLQNQGFLADLSYVDYSRFADDVNVSKNFVIEYRTSGAIVVNTRVLERLGLPEPTCYEDLLDPMYKGHISMADPKASGTGYMFLKNLVNVWGEDKAFEYFEKLAPNVLQFTSSGNGPINALVQEEAAVGLCMTVNAVRQINQGDPLKILFFNEGAPSSMYGQAIPKKNENDSEIKEIFNYMIGDLLEYMFKNYGHENCIKGLDAGLENYPDNIVYGDMSNDTIDEKERLLEKWNLT